MKYMGKFSGESLQGAYKASLLSVEALRKMQRSRYLQALLEYEVKITLTKHFLEIIIKYLKTKQSFLS